MHRFPIPCLAIGILVIGIHAVALADEDLSPEAKKQIAALDAQVKALQAQIVLLKKELDDAKATIKTLEQGAKGGGPPVEGEKPDPSKSPEKTDRKVTIDNPADLLRNLPADLRPKPNIGWDKFALEKVKDWAKAQNPNANYDANMIIVNVSVKHLDEFERRQRNTPKEWLVTIDVQWRDFPLGNQIMRPRLPHAGTAFGIPVDEDVAKRAEKLKKGATIRVQGTIAGLEINRTSTSQTNEWYLLMQFSEVKIPALSP